MKTITNIIKNIILSIIGLFIMISSIGLEMRAASIINNIVTYLDIESYSKALYNTAIFIGISIVILIMFIIGLVMFMKNFSIDDSIMDDNEK
jgi:uncharacterized membrane protein